MPRSALQSTFAVAVEGGTSATSLTNRREAALPDERSGQMNQERAKKEELVIPERPIVVSLPSLGESGRQYHSHTYPIVFVAARTSLADDQ